MRVFIYSLQTAFKNLWREKWINFLTVLSIGVSLLILSIYLMIIFNVDYGLKRWSKGFGLVVYLQKNLNKIEEDTLNKLFAHDTDVLEVRYISKEQALEDLRGVLGSKALILEELGENPLPSSFELKLKEDLLSPSLVEIKAAEIRQMAGVEDVEYGEKWLSSLNTISKNMKVIAVVLGGAIFIAITFVTYSTIKILFYRRISEIETLKLLGAARIFIKLPFLIEGLFIGGIGGAISSLALFGMHFFIVFKLIEFFPLFKTIVLPLPVETYLVTPFAGALMGLLGSFFATGRIRY